MNESLQAVFADEKGKVYPLRGLEPLGMKAGQTFQLSRRHAVKLPSSSELLALPHRHPLVWDALQKRSYAITQDPYSRTKKIAYAVAAFIPPGYTLTHHSAFTESSDVTRLPLLAYGACFYYKGDFYVSAIKVDARHRHTERFMSRDKVEEGVRRYEKMYAQNRLIGHLKNCALVYGCANAKNFFLRRMECPIPSSPVCNAQCRGCISLQPDGDIPSNQDRIAFVPTVQEIEELTLAHFSVEKDPIVSFGQGCEGEPSLQARVLSQAIQRVRQQSDKGIIHMNTNAGDPKAIRTLFEAGLQSIRVSLNSTQKKHYTAYYQPKNYDFSKVIESIKVAKSFGGYVSINYLSMPGFTDRVDEYQALCHFIKEYRIDMIQWRNLNYDPLIYFRQLGIEADGQLLLGMDWVIKNIHKKYPHLRRGYFNMTKKQMGVLSA